MRCHRAARWAAGAIGLGMTLAASARAADPLPSWSPGAAKIALVEFVEAKVHGWTVVDMKQDWKRVFAAP